MKTSNNYEQFEWSGNFNSTFELYAMKGENLIADTFVEFIHFKSDKGSSWTVLKLIKLK